MSKCPRHPNIRPYETGILAGACRVCGYPLKNLPVDLYGVEEEAEG